MQHHACGIDYGAQRILLQGGEGLFHASFDGQTVAASRADIAPRFVQGAADFTEQERAGKMPQGRGEPFQNLVYRGKFPQQIAFGHDSDGTRLLKRYATDYTKRIGAWLSLAR